VVHALAASAADAAAPAHDAILGPPRTMFARETVEVFTRTNLWLMIINLLPFPPLDGAEAWKIVGELKHRRWASGKVLGGSGSSKSDDLLPEEARRIAKAFEDAVKRR